MYKMRNFNLSFIKNELVFIELLKLSFSRIFGFLSKQNEAFKMNRILCNFGIYLFQKCLNKTVKLYQSYWENEWLNSHQKTIRLKPRNESKCMHRRKYYLNMYVMWKAPHKKTSEQSWNVDDSKILDFCLLLVTFNPGPHTYDANRHQSSFMNRNVTFKVKFL